MNKSIFIGFLLNEKKYIMNEEEKRVSKNEHALETDIQDKSSLAWEKLCEYVDKVETEGSEEFSPLEYLGEELFEQIHTLPESIAKLKKVKKIWHRR